MSVTEYDRRFDLIMECFASGYFTATEASAAIAELTAARARRVH